MPDLLIVTCNPLLTFTRSNSSGPLALNRNDDADFAYFGFLFHCPMTRLMILLIALVTSGLSIAQIEAQRFPEAYFGRYVGDLVIKSAMEDQFVPMEFHLFPGDTLGRYEYKLVYGMGDTRQERAYELVALNAENGQFEIDEKNGIILDCQIVENKMYSLFEVQGNILTTFITFEEDHAMFEIVFAPKATVRNTISEDGDQIQVSAYPISVVQTAKLLKE